LQETITRQSSSYTQVSPIYQEQIRAIRGKKFRHRLFMPLVNNLKLSTLITFNMQTFNPSTLISLQP